MGLFSWFNKEENSDITAENMFSEEITIKDHCKTCPLKRICTNKGKPKDICIYAINVDDIDFDKDILLIIDDDRGMISFIEDDIEYYKEENIMPDNIEVLTIGGNNAAFSLELLFKKLPNLHIKYAIIDITLGGSRQTENGNIKYTGVDVFEMLYNANKDIRYIFYTGNNLNPYIKSNEALIEKFFKITGENIQDHLLFKTSIDMDARREYMPKILFKDY